MLGGGESFGKIDKTFPAGKPGGDSTSPPTFSFVENSVGGGGMMTLRGSAEACSVGIASTETFQVCNPSGSLRNASSVGNG